MWHGAPAARMVTAVACDSRVHLPPERPQGTKGNKILIEIVFDKFLIQRDQ